MGVGKEKAEAMNCVRGIGKLFTKSRNSGADHHEKAAFLTLFI